MEQSCSGEALNVTLEKDDIDGKTPMLSGQEIVCLVTAAGIQSPSKGKKTCYHGFPWKAFSSAGLAIEEVGMPGSCKANRY